MRRTEKTDLLIGTHSSQRQLVFDQGQWVQPQEMVNCDSFALATFQVDSVSAAALTLAIVAADVNYKSKPESLSTSKIAVKTILETFQDSALGDPLVLLEAG